jgi:aminoglycoside 6'-N-acetyltransferase I
MDLRLISKKEDIRSRRREIGMILTDFFPNRANAWPSQESAEQEVEDSLKNDKPRLSIIALCGDEVAGWIAGQDFYAKVIEIHPLAVKRSFQRCGIGKNLVNAFESEAKKLGYGVVFVGSDDTDNSTSLGGMELYPDALGKLNAIRNLRNHPFEFYQRCGYECVGVLPDANGKGKPDIYLAKTLR